MDIMYYGRSQCALHHSILSSIKLFFGMYVQEKYGWIIYYEFLFELPPGELGQTLNMYPANIFS